MMRCLSNAKHMAAVMEIKASTLNASVPGLTITIKPTKPTRVAIHRGASTFSLSINTANGKKNKGSVNIIVVFSQLDSVLLHKQ